MSVVRARQLVAIKRWDEAVEVLAPSLADPASGAEPWCLLAQARLAQGRAKDGESAAQRALALAPDDEWAHRLHALALLRLSKPRKALVSAERALALAPYSAQAVHLVVLTELALRHRARAAQVAQAGLHRIPHQALSFQTAAAVALAQRQWAEAERLTRAGLELDPQDTDLMLQLGKALERQGRNAEAGEIYAAAGRSDPTDHRARRALGRIGAPAALVSALLFKGIGTKVAMIVWLRAVLFTGTAALVGALSLSAVAAGAFAVTEVRHRRARTSLPAGLRAVAVREHRTDLARWAVAGALFALLVALAAFPQSHPTLGWAAVTLLAGCTVAAVRLRRHLRATAF